MGDDPATTHLRALAGARLASIGAEADSGFKAVVAGADAVAAFAAIRPQAV